MGLAAVCRLVSYGGFPRRLSSKHPCEWYWRQGWLGPWAQGATLSNKPRPGDANTPVINGLLLGLVTVITPCVFGGNDDFQGYFHGVITAIARLITAIRPLLQQ